MHNIGTTYTCKVGTASGTSSFLARLHGYIMHVKVFANPRNKKP